jgi:O-antigen ligase
VSRAGFKELNRGAVAFLLLAPLSAAWSIDSSATLLRCVSLTTIYLICFALTVDGWQRTRFQRLALPPLLLILIGSLIVGIYAPDRIIEIGEDLSQKGAWHGITHSKNEFGMMAGSATIICVNRVLSRESGSLWAIIGAAISFTCLVLSRSHTSLFACLLGVLAMVMLMRVPIIRQRYSKVVVIGIAATLLTYEMAVQNVVPGAHTLLSPITSLTGKDTTLSGRTIIWDIIKQHIAYAPYLGTGYGAYWTGPFPSSPSYVFVPVMYFYPTEAHNGYLDIVNDLGMVGLACLLLYQFVYIRQALELMQTDRSQASLYLAIFFLQMVMNMSESEWFARSSTAAVLVLATCSLSRAVRETRLLATSAPQMATRQPWLRKQSASRS